MQIRGHERATPGPPDTEFHTQSIHTLSHNGISSKLVRFYGFAYATLSPKGQSRDALISAEEMGKKSALWCGTMQNSHDSRGGRAVVKYYP